MKNSMWLAKILRYIARTSLVMVSGFWFVFALLSGAERFGGGLRGLIRNSPNAWPWLCLLGVVYIAFRWELIGGPLITVLGVLTIAHFGTLESLPLFLTLSLPLIIMGGCLTLSGYLTQTANARRRQKFRSINGER
ncbi:MAG: hypothetical protein F6K00_33245 [Leptolyngbya sp. SIOISBB]|nr:hypothetical protein [Leptolyngbya sp. SIOISBB]